MNFEDVYRGHFLELFTLDRHLEALRARLKHNLAVGLTQATKCSSVVKVTNLHAPIQPSCNCVSSFCCLHPILTCHSQRRKAFASYLDSLGKALCSNEVHAKMIMSAIVTASLQNLSG